jgi:hypothetical protein
MGRRREAGAAAARWRGESSCGVGEAQRSGETASRGPGAATYREEKIREGRQAEVHGGVEGAVLAALRRPVARAWQSRKGATEAG